MSNSEYSHLGTENVLYLKLPNSKGLVLFWSFLISEDRRSPAQTPRISMHSRLLYVEHNLQRVNIPVHCLMSSVQRLRGLQSIGLPEEEYAHQCWPYWVCNIGQEDAIHNNTISTKTSQYIIIPISGMYFGVRGMLSPTVRRKTIRDRNISA